MSRFVEEIVIERQHGRVSMVRLLDAGGEEIAGLPCTEVEYTDKVQGDSVVGLFVHGSRVRFKDIGDYIRETVPEPRPNIDPFPWPLEPRIID